jgi:hypothetical protein
MKLDTNHRTASDLGLLRRLAMHAHRCTPTVVHSESSRIGCRWSLTFLFFYSETSGATPALHGLVWPVAMRQNPGHLLRFIAVNAQNRNAARGSKHSGLIIRLQRDSRVKKVPTPISSSPVWPTYFSPDVCSPVENCGFSEITDSCRMITPFMHHQPYAKPYLVMLL